MAFFTSFYTHPPVEVKQADNLDQGGAISGKFLQDARNRYPLIKLHGTIPDYRGKSGDFPILRHVHRRQGGDIEFKEHRCLRSEEHTSELQSPDHLVCRLLLEKKKKIHKKNLNQTKCKPVK